MKYGFDSRQAECFDESAGGGNEQRRMDGTAKRLLNALREGA
jgi:hypothetical protein